MKSWFDVGLNTSDSIHFDLVVSFLTVVIITSLAQDPKNVLYFLLLILFF